MLRKQGLFGRRAGCCARSQHDWVARLLLAFPGFSDADQSFAPKGWGNSSHTAFIIGHLACEDVVTHKANHDAIRVHA
jgi:hypothetical protein